MARRNGQTRTSRSTCSSERSNFCCASAIACSATGSNTGFGPQGRDLGYRVPSCVGFHAGARQGQLGCVCQLTRWPSDEHLAQVAQAIALPVTSYIVQAGEQLELRWMSKGGRYVQSMCGHGTLAASMRDGAAVPGTSRVRVHDARRRCTCQARRRHVLFGIAAVGQPPDARPRRNWQRRSARHLKRFTTRGGTRSRCSTRKTRYERSPRT
jgi:hypothetical protein